MSLATLESLETKLNRLLSDSEKQQASKLLNQAEVLLLARIPDLYERAAEDETYNALVEMTEAEAVARVLRAENGGIYRSESDESYSYSLNFQVASGLLDILPAEWKRLGANSPGTVTPETDGYVRNRIPWLNPTWRFEHDAGGDPWQAC